MNENNYKLLLILSLIVILYLVNNQLNPNFLNVVRGKVSVPGMEKFGNLFKKKNTKNEESTNTTPIDKQTIKYDIKKPAGDLNVPYTFKNATYGVNDFLDDGDDGTLGLQSSLCSPACCYQQYPLPFKQKVDPEILKNIDKYVPTSYTCRNTTQGSGCLCMTEKQQDYLHSRGGNK